ncbi:MAG: LysE family transporter, partial [Bacteroidales bacterium]|nr:LysE family transporter [Bacteroidales bacterium]
RGMQAGILFATGIIVGDFLIVYLSYLGAAQILENPRNHLLFSIVGGAMLIIFGLATFTRKVIPKEKTRELQIKLPGPSIYVLKGFFLNFANPFLWFFWISLMVGISSNYGGNKNNIISFFSGALLTIFGTDIGKVIIAQRLKRFITHRVILWINRLVGTVLIVFGIVLIVRIFVNVDLPTIK